MYTTITYSFIEKENLFGSIRKINDWFGNRNSEENFKKTLVKEIFTKKQYNYFTYLEIHE